MQVSEPISEQKQTPIVEQPPVAAPKKIEEVKQTTPFPTTNIVSEPAPAKTTRTERKRKSSGGGLSINSILNKKEEKEQEEDTESLGDMPTKDFTEEQLKKVWKLYADKVKLSGKMNFYTTLTKTEIKIEGTTITLPIDNATQEIDVNQEKTEILSYIRKELQNYSITLESIIMKDTNPQKKLYTTTDKFNRMAEKNPNLLILKDRLNLEIDI